VGWRWWVRYAVVLVVQGIVQLLIAWALGLWR
jgi:hypothetical protein